MEPWYLGGHAHAGHIGEQILVGNAVGREAGSRRARHLTPACHLQLILCTVGIHHHAPRGVFKVEPDAVSLCPIMRPYSAVLPFLPLLDLHCIETAGSVTDGAVDKLVALGLAMNAHKAHCDAADGHPWRVLQEARFAVGAEPSEKRHDPAEKAHHQADIQITDIRRHGMFLLGLSPGLGRRHDHTMDISRHLYKGPLFRPKVTGSSIVLLRVRRAT